MPLPSTLPAPNPYGPLITFQTENILPPSAIYISPQDLITVNVTSPSVTANVTVSYRLLKPDGTLITTADSFVAPAAGSFAANLQIPPAEGFLLSLVVRSDNVSRGQAFVRVFLFSGALSAGAVNPHMFAQGYVSTLDVVTFPQSTAESSLSGRGWLHDVLVSAGLGLNAVFTVPAHVHWLIRAIQFALVTSGAAGNRTGLVKVSDPIATTTLQVAAPTAVGPGTTTTYAFAPGIAVYTVGTFQGTGFPVDFILPNGWSLIAGAFNLDVADAIGSAVLTVEEFVGE